MLAKVEFLPKELSSIAKLNICEYSLVNIVPCSFVGKLVTPFPELATAGAEPTKARTLSAKFSVAKFLLYIDVRVELLPNCQYAPVGAIPTTPPTYNSSIIILSASLIFPQDFVPFTQTFTIVVPPVICPTTPPILAVFIEILLISIFPETSPPSKSVWLIKPTKPPTLIVSISDVNSPLST